MSLSSSRLLALTLVSVLALTGCGKSLESSSSSAGSSAVTFVHAAGAGGLITSNTTRLGGPDPVTDAAAVARAAYSGLTTATRPQAVVLVDEQGWPAALAAAALAGAPAGAPLLYTEGDELPAVSAEALAAMRPTGNLHLAGAQTIEIGNVASPTSYKAHAVKGKNQFVLAAKIEKLLKRLHGGVAPTAVIVVSATGPRAFAMPAAGLAAESGTPILFTTTNGIPSATRSVLERLHGPRIYAIGPSSAISGSVLAELGHFGSVRSIEGQTPVENAIAVARYTDGSFGWGVDEPGHGLVFLNLSRSLDAPAAASLSASGDYGPLLLLENADSVPDALSSYLSGIQPGFGQAPEYGPVRAVYNHGWLIGDEEAISASVQGELDSMLKATPRSVPTSQPSVGP